MAEQQKYNPQEAAQRHHDYYVRLEQAGTLTEEDKPHLKLAKEREAAGQVKPLAPETPPTEG